VVSTSTWHGQQEDWQALPQQLLLVTNFRDMLVEIDKQLQGRILFANIKPSIRRG